MPITTPHFLTSWIAEVVPRYVAEYGGERAGTAKGNSLPVPSQKIAAALYHVMYGAPAVKTLRTVAKLAGTSEGMLRVWRTEERFRALCRQLAWECVDAFILHVVALLSGEESWDLKAQQDYRRKYEQVHEDFKLFGTAAQQGILRRINVEVLHLFPKWPPFKTSKRLRAEVIHLGNPPRPLPHLSDRQKVQLQEFASAAILNVHGYKPSRAVLYRWYDTAVLGWTECIRINLLQVVQWLREERTKDALGQLESLLDAWPESKPEDALTSVKRKQANLAKVCTL